jgi:quercetin dioxygenase-like cupin family protein
MKNRCIPMFVALFACVSSLAQTTTIGEMKFPEGTVQHVVRANEIQWKPCPPNLPKGCEMCILEGDPKSADMFTVRFKVNGSFVMPPHTHPKDERVTIIQGRAYVSFDNKPREQATAFGPGDYYVNARGAVHSVWADDNTIIQITGIGPWVADFVEKK